MVAIVIVAILVVGTRINAANADIHPIKLLKSGPPNGYGIPLTQKGVPAFTVNDVVSYVTTHPFAGGPTISGKPPSVVSVKFITSQLASQNLNGESTGLSDNASVCYVELYGPFTLEGASVPLGAKLHPANNVIEVFDASTGNLLMWHADQ